MEGMSIFKKSLVLPMIFLSQTTCWAGENAAPSSHLVYNDASFPGDVLINEVRVPKAGEAMYTYYETLGWSGLAAGYAGIQAHPNGHNYIFSIWDNKKQSAPIRAVYHGAGTKTEKFGGEGTGLKSWNFELGWDTGVWYSLVSRCWPVADHTFYGFWVRSGKTEEWTHLVTMDVAAKDAYFQGGNDSFIEDWLETGKNMREIHLRKGWKRNLEGEWLAFEKGRYSVNSWDLKEGKRSYNFRENWDGGVEKDETGPYFYMTSGGKKTKPSTENPSDHVIKREEKKPNFVPTKILSATLKAADSEMVLDWQLDPKSAPQLSYAITVRIGDEVNVLVSEQTEPHVRRHQFVLPENMVGKDAKYSLHIRDVFDGVSVFELP